MREDDKYLLASGHEQVRVVIIPINPGVHGRARERARFSPLHTDLRQVLSPAPFLGSCVLSFSYIVYLYLNEPGLLTRPCLENIR